MYDISYSDNALMKEVGRFLKSTRVSQNITQDELAERAAISRSTLSLAERGENISLLNLLKILRQLDALYVLDKFRVRKTVSPLLLAEEEAKMRRRASRHNKSKDDLGW